MSRRLYFEAEREGEFIRFRIGFESLDPPRRFAWLWRLLRRIRDWGRFSQPLHRWTINTRGAVEFRTGIDEQIVLDGVRIRFEVLRVEGPGFDPQLLRDNLAKRLVLIHGGNPGDLSA